MRVWIYNAVCVSVHIYIMHYHKYTLLFDLNIQFTMCIVFMYAGNNILTYRILTQHFLKEFHHTCPNIF